MSIERKTILTVRIRPEPARSELDIANMVTRPIVSNVRFNRNFLALATVSLLVVLGSGCGGISTTQSVSPATFFMPGLMQVTPKAVDPLAPAFLPAEYQTAAQAQ